MMFDAARFEEAPAQVDWIVRASGVDAPGPVLDLCCGVGRHTLEFARRGYEVTGVDRCEPYLDRARVAAAEEGVSATWVPDDMRRFRREGAFALAINLFTSFGYFDDPAEDALVARNVCASLRPGGRFVLEIKGKEPLARVFRPCLSRRLADGSLFVQESRLIDAWERCETRWLVIRPDGERIVGTLTTRLYSATELRALLLTVGFETVEFYGDLAGAPFDHTATRLVALATR